MYKPGISIEISQKPGEISRQEISPATRAKADPNVRFPRRVTLAIARMLANAITRSINLLREKFLSKNAISFPTARVYTLHSRSSSVEDNQIFHLFMCVCVCVIFVEATWRYSKIAQL